MDKARGLRPSSTPSAYSCVPTPFIGISGIRLEVAEIVEARGIAQIEIVAGAEPSGPPNRESVTTSLVQFSINDKLIVAST